MSDVTIQINSLPALERLLGDDPVMEVNVRNAVVQNFAKNFAKHLANSTAVADELRRMEKKVMEQMTDIVTKEVRVIAPNFDYGKYVLSEKTKYDLRKAVTLEIEVITAQVIVETVTPDTVEKLIEQRVKQIVNPTVDRAIEAAVQGKIKEILADGKNSR